MSEITLLIRRWQAGDERAAEALYNQFSHSVFSLAYTLLGDRADAEEAAQDALTYALTHIERYDSRQARFSTWLHTITSAVAATNAVVAFCPACPCSPGRRVVAMSAIRPPARSIKRSGKRRAMKFGRQSKV